jgi:dipeptidyl aminopeptidase/acylaminoacyl peptidase
MNPEQYLDALLNLPNMISPAVSRDGKWVAWVWLNASPAADVYAAPTDGSSLPIRLTSTLERTTLEGWTPDSQAVLVSEDTGGNERARLFRVDLARPEVMLPLTEADPHFFVRGGELHPNGHWLIYGANFDYAAGQEIEPTWIYRTDLASEEHKLLAHPFKPCFFSPQLSPTGDHILYTRADRHPAGRQVWMVDIEGRQDREILNFGNDVKVSASWFPDGKRLLVLAETQTHKLLGMRDLASEEMTWLIDDPERSIEQAFVPFRSEHIVIQEVRQARLRASLLDPRTKIETLLPSLPGNLNPLAPVGGGFWVGLYSSSRQPAEIARFRPADHEPGRLKLLARVAERTTLRKENLTPAEDFHWQSMDGLELQGWLYRACGASRGTVVFVHGGPTFHSTDRIVAQIQFLTSMGFNVFDPNYRGSTGFGLPFRNAIKVDGWGGREQEDIRTGIEALFTARVAFPGRVGITGTSYGGYSAWHAITHFLPEVVAAAAPICGMTDLVLDYHTTRPDLRRYSEEMLGGSPEQVPEIYFKRSPIHFLHNIQGPLLIVQGLQDPNVSPENVRAVRQGLDAGGIPYEILTFADEGHGIYRPANQRVLFQRLAEFFGKALA